MEKPVRFSGETVPMTGPTLPNRQGHVHAKREETENDSCVQLGGGSESSLARPSSAYHMELGA
jgi:hypothetical protein